MSNAGRNLRTFIVERRAHGPATEEIRKLLPLEIRVEAEPEAAKDSKTFTDGEPIWEVSPDLKWRLAMLLKRPPSFVEARRFVCRCMGRFREDQ